MFGRDRNNDVWREGRGWSALWSRYKLECLFGLALLLTLLLGRYPSHPGTDVAVGLVILDLLAWIVTRRSSVRRFLWFFILNVIGLIIILVASDAVELWFTGLCGLYAILILLSEVIRSRF